MAGVNPVYELWWRTSMDARGLLRFVAERFRFVAPVGVRLRWLLHLMVGNPIQVAGLVSAMAAWRTGAVPFRVALLVWFLSWALVEVHHRLAFGCGSWMVGWREGWRVRRQLPAVWASVAAKTDRVQAEVGTSKEPIASAVLRPVADHPKMSWWPRIEWPVVSWWVGPPPGRSFNALDEVTDALAANLTHAVDVTVDYNRETDSFGRLTVAFLDVLATPVPIDGGAMVDLADDDGDLIDPEAALALLDDLPLPRRHLRVVGDEDEIEEPY